MKIRNFKLFPLALAAAMVAQNACAQSGDVTINFVTPGVGDWNVAANWLTAPPENLTVVPGDNFAREVVSISNGGTAFLSAPAQFPVDGLLLGDIPAATGKLEIRSGGSLTVVDGDPGEPGREGGVFVGTAGTGTLAVNGGTLNASFMIVSGGTGSALETSGAANINVTGDAILLQNYRQVGSNVNFNVGGNLVITGSFSTEITSATHTAIQVPTGNATFGAAGLNVKFSGFAPDFGDAWTLIDANSVVGEFGPVKISGVVLPRGLVVAPTMEAATGDVKIVTDNRLILNVNRATGATSIENAIGAPIAIDGYTIASPGGHLLSSNARWSSLDDQNEGAFIEADPTSNFLSELNPTGSYAFSVGNARTLGTPYSYTPTEFGVSGDDLVFEYTTPDGEIQEGVIEYSGPINNLVLTVDPATGEGVLQNQSPFTVAIDGYSILSASGSLTPAGWTSLDDQNISTWAEANPDATALSELLPVGGFTITPNASFNLGDLFSTSGERDLELVFTFADGTLFNGEVVYGAASVGQAGDTNGDGLVDLTDLNNVRNNFGGVGLGDTDGDNDVDLDDLNSVRNNFGAGGSPTAVPEPSTFVLAGAGLLALAGLRKRRNR